MDISVSSLWGVLGIGALCFMQAGFAFLEKGFARSKNAGSAMIKHLVCFAIGSLTFILFGFGFMGPNGNAFIGRPDPFLQLNYTGGLPLYLQVCLLAFFCSTILAIVSGAIAERGAFIPFCLFSIVLCGFIFPVAAHWAQPGGWLYLLGFHDQGGALLNLTGGAAALAAAKMVGPRAEKYGPNKKPRAILGASVSSSALGVFIIAACWVVFTTVLSVLRAGQATEVLSKIMMNNVVALLVATISAFIVTHIRYGASDVTITFNGVLGGLAAVSAGSDIISPFGAAVIALVAVLVMIVGLDFVEGFLRIDDPVGSISVHGSCAIVGTVLTGFFGTGAEPYFLGVQALGTAAIFGWTLLLSLAFLFIIGRLVPLRVAPQAEQEGLDLSEHGLIGQCNLMPYAADNYLAYSSAEEAVPEAAFPIPGGPEKPAAPAPAAAERSALKITTVAIVTRPEKFEALKQAMYAIGITGMTVYNVMGCGIQKGASELYRGTPVEINVRPKIKVEIVVCKVPVRTVIETAKRVLGTGHIGDGKIFQYDTENVIKIRTGEEAYDALQDVE